MFQYFRQCCDVQLHSLSCCCGTNYLDGHQTAHHKLYTALDQHVSDEDCYEGYLWAPFDTFLNVARLLQFNRNKIWYHSPFGVPVPNPALENATQHAPPARISPDPYGNVTEIWKHWGRDWWFVLCGATALVSIFTDLLLTGGGGLNIVILFVTYELSIGPSEPHVGLNVCMPAFEKAPLHMRQHLASLTGNETRLIGGSSDTIYFPREPRVHLTLTSTNTILNYHRPILFIDEGNSWPLLRHQLLPRNRTADSATSHY